MARPYKTGLDCFPLDVDFFVDDKMIAITGEFSIKGELTAIHLLCAIYRNGYYVEWNERLCNKLHSELSCVSTNLINMIVNRLVQWDFFDKDLFYTSSILTSRGIQRRYFDSVRKRKKQSLSLPYLLISLPGQPKQSEAPEVANPGQVIPVPTAADPGSGTIMTRPITVPQPASPPVISGNSDNAKCLARFFGDGNMANIEMLMMNLSLRPEDKGLLRTVAETVVNEWNAASIAHRDYSDWARHLINTMRIKLQEAEKGKKKNYNKQQKTTAPTANSYQFDGGFGGQDI